MYESNYSCPRYKYRADWALLTWYGNQFRRRKTLNSNLLNSTLKLTLCHILWRGWTYKHIYIYYFEKCIVNKHVMVKLTLQQWNWGIWEVMTKISLSLPSGIKHILLIKNVNVYIFLWNCDTLTEYKNQINFHKFHTIRKNRIKRIFWYEN